MRRLAFAPRPNTFSCRKESVHAPQNPLQRNGQKYRSDVLAVRACQFAVGSPVAMQNRQTNCALKTRNEGNNAKNNVIQVKFAQIIAILHSHSA